jgi:hypothetical protein
MKEELRIDLNGVTAVDCTTARVREARENFLEEELAPTYNQTHV